jgi:hypothetical protein
MRFALVVTGGGRGEVALAGPRQRVLLAALLLHANVPVRPGALAEMMWDGSPPPAAGVTLHSYVRRLRRALGPRPGGGGGGQGSGLPDPGRRAGARCAGVRGEVPGGGGCAVGPTRRPPPYGRRGCGEPSRCWMCPLRCCVTRSCPGLSGCACNCSRTVFQAGLRLGQHQELVPQLLDLTARHP